MLSKLINSLRARKQSFLSLPLIFFSLLFIMPLNVVRVEGVQDKEGLARLAQIHAAMEYFREGRKLVADEQWASAAVKFNKAIELYPKGDPADAALYWLAFSLREQGKFEEAKKALLRLFDEFPNSNWINDATAMRLEIASRLGEKEVVTRIVRREVKPNDEVQIAAMQSLFKTDLNRALALVDETLMQGSPSSMRLKEAALTLLGMNGGQAAVARLMEIARGEKDKRLRKKAIYWLGRSNDSAARQLLRELAASSRDREISEAALAAVPERLKRAAWLVVKEGGHVLEFSKDRVIKIEGDGKLNFKHDGRVVEIPDDNTVKVNGKAVPTQGQIVQEGDEVHIVDQSDKIIWTLSLMPDEPNTGFDNLSFNGEFTFMLDSPEAYLVKPTAEGMRMRTVAPAVKFGVKTDSVDGALAAQLGLRPGAAELVTEVSEGVLTVPNGLRKFDVITHVDGKALTGEGEMWPTIYKRSPDAASDRLRLRVIRNREAFDVIYAINHANGVWSAQTRAADTSATASSSNSSSSNLPATSDVTQQSYQISIGSEPKLLLLNSHGELFLRSRKGVLDAMIDGQAVPSNRLVREGGIVRVLSANGETLFVVGILPNGSLIYSNALDPFTARGRLGMTTDGIGNALAAQLNLKPQQALLVTNVLEGMPAALSGAKVSDLIVGIDGQSLDGPKTLDQILFQKKRGDTLKLLVLRNGEAREVVIEIKDDPRWQDFRKLEKRYLEMNRKLL